MDDSRGKTVALAREAGRVEGLGLAVDIFEAAQKDVLAFRMPPPGSPVVDFWNAAQRVIRLYQEASLRTVTGMAGEIEAARLRAGDVVGRGSKIVKH